MDQQRRLIERAATKGDCEALLRLHQHQRRAGELCAECGVALPPEFVGVEFTCPGCQGNRCPECDTPFITVADPGPGDRWNRCPKCRPPGPCAICRVERTFDDFGWPECLNRH
jgi:hypothetical protein